MSKLLSFRFGKQKKYDDFLETDVELWSEVDIMARKTWGFYADEWRHNGLPQLVIEFGPLIFRYGRYSGF